MNEEISAAGQATSLYRIDRFTVPAEARDAFLGRIVFIRDFLASQPGCLYNRIAESRRDDGFISMMTIVEWRDRPSMEAARTSVKARYDEIGFNPQAFMTELGIDPDFGLFADIPARDPVMA
ncbi:MAG: antibiotic biosynthesis monooxygenase family protein [Oricola sp.]